MKPDGEVLKQGRPIKILPKKEFTVQRLIVRPTKVDGRKKYYVRHPALITVKAFTGGEACAAADEIVANTHEKIWSSLGSRPWAANNTPWIEEELPPDVEPLILG